MTVDAVSLEQINARLGKIDEKLDKVISLEADVRNWGNAHNRLEGWVKEVSGRVHSLEMKASADSVKTQSHGSALWLLLTSATSLALGALAAKLFH